MADDAEDLRRLANRVLNEDHGHAHQEGGEVCKTCYRRSVKVVDAIKAHGWRVKGQMMTRKRAAADQGINASRARTRAELPTLADLDEMNEEGES